MPVACGIARPREIWNIRAWCRLSLFGWNTADSRVQVSRLLHPYHGILPLSFSLYQGQHLIFAASVHLNEGKLRHLMLLFQHFTFESNQLRETIRPASVLLLGGSHPLGEAPEGYLGRVVRQVDVERVPFTDLQRGFKELHGLLPARCCILRSCGGSTASTKDTHNVSS